MIPAVGAVVLPYIGTLFVGYLSNCEAPEMLDFLPFMSVVIFRFKKMTFDIMQDVFPRLLGKIIQFTQVEPEGYNEKLNLLELRKNFCYVISSFMTAELEGVFTTTGKTYLGKANDRKSSTFADVDPAFTSIWKHNGRSAYAEACFPCARKIIFCITSTWT
jgi:hypothetical protein